MTMTFRLRALLATLTLLTGCARDSGTDAINGTGAQSAGGSDNGTCPAGSGTSPCTTSSGLECVFLDRDAVNCGSCGFTCDNGQTCVAGECACMGGATDCGSGCLDLSSSPTNCGSCGNNCGAQVCDNGTCSATCSSGLQNCSGACVNLLTSATDCGTCGNACQGSLTCNNGSCGCATGTQCNTQCCAAGQVCDGATGSCTLPGGDNTGGQGGAGGANNGGSGNVSSGNTGNLPSGGTAGNDAQGGSGNTGNTGGAGNTGNTGNTGDDPPGYWRFGDWNGCVWTGIDDTNVGTTALPQDFLTHTSGDPYCISGEVGPHPEYESVALLGFNLAEPAAGTTCEYKPVDTSMEGPPGVALTEAGIAANFVKQGGDTSFTLRVQLQGPNGASDENDRWCATIEEVQGKVFVRYEDFNTACWDGSGNDYAGEPISAIVFLVPGDPEPVPYDFCINGFAAGNDASDAPDGTAEAGDQTGTVGSSAPDGDFERAKVLVGGENYIIQNNNWGNPGGTDLILNYTNNSFVVASGSGSGSGDGAPASFPSIYIGANGNTANGVFSTSTTDNLPIQISNIESIPTKFSWSGSTSSFNSTYDVWFADSPPSSEYTDGISGFIMVWLHDPADAQPIGSQMGTANIEGRDWQVWSGPRGSAPDGSTSNAPVISYVANGDVPSFSFDLKSFITDAVNNRGFNGSFYLTDVFAGFEIWQGGAGGNLSVTEFTCVVNP